MSRRSRNGRIICTDRWAQGRIAFGNRHVPPIEVLHRVLDGVGDPSKERLFRMNVSLCLHRGATVEEIAGLPQRWQDDTAGMAGGPVEVLWEMGCKALSSALPCERPEHILPDLRRPDLWIPNDCGECDPCKARLEISAREAAVR